jgi:hypothetical protein
VDDLIRLLRERIQEPSTRTDSGDPTVAHYPPVAETTMTDTEAELGFHLPVVLRRVYTEVANGGFGPGLGLLSADVEDEPCLVTVYRESCAGEYPPQLSPSGRWPARLLPICDWGDAIWTCVDWSTSDGTIVIHDDVDGPTRTEFNVYTWLTSWANDADIWDTMYEDREVSILNPFTRWPVKTRIRGHAKGWRWKP